MSNKFEDARLVNKKVQANIFANFKDIVSIGVGHKIVSGVSTGEPCISIGVLKKGGKLSKDQIIPYELDGIKTDIIEEDIPVPDTTSWRRPLVGGLSIGPSNQISAGTLGCCVYHNSLGTVKCGITNAHVLIYNNGLYGVPSANPTQYLACSSVSSPCQPGRLDTAGNVAYPVGYALPYVSTVLLNGVDAAVFVVSGTGVDITPNSIYDINLPNGLFFTANNLAIGDPLIKHGRTSNTTTGTVVALDVSTWVNYFNCDGSSYPILMPHQTKATLMTQSGDSGSIVLKNNTSRPVVGLHFASSSTYSYSNEWGNVQSVMGIHL